MFYQLIICLLCLCVFWRLWRRKKIERDPPELSRSFPIIGHSYMFLGDSISYYKNIIKVADECIEKGGVLSFNVGFQNGYAVTDPEDILTISNTCLKKEYVYDFAKEFVGEGLITGNGETWKTHRKLLNPAFSQPIINSFIESFNSQARNLVEQLVSQLGIPFDHEAVLRQNNLQSICLTTTGVGGDEYGSLQQEYLSLVPKIQMIFYERFQQLWLHSDFIYNMSKLKKKQDVIIKPIRRLSNLIIKNKKADMKSLNESHTQTSPRKHKPFLELLLEISKESEQFTDEQIRHETDTIIAAGHETTATVLNLALILLGSYPDIQAKVYNEILEVVGSIEKDFDKDDLSKLVYTQAVLKETLRLYPVVPVVARRIDKPVELKNYTLKANSPCFLFLNGLNRHPAWGPDVNEFRPERWLDTKTLPERCYFGSFAIGKRNCIGKAYAMMVMKTTLAHVIRRYQVSADISKVVLKWHMLTYPASGHHYILERR